MYTESDAQKVKELLKVPYSSCYLSTLGGKENAAIMLRVSLDSEDTWANKIFHNSRHGFFTIDAGKVECFGKSYDLPTFRKSKIKSIEHACEKIQAWIDNNI